MRVRLLLLLAAALALLLVAFAAYQGRAEAFRGLSLRGPVLVSSHQVVVRVWVMELNGVWRPDAGALVAVGHQTAVTDEKGIARLVIPGGSYSTYVKSSDNRLLPLTTSLKVDSNLTMNVWFELTKLSPENIKLSVSSGSTVIRLRLSSSGDGKSFISYPYISALTSWGAPVTISRGDGEYSYFFQQVPSWPFEIELQVEEELASIDPQRSYVPLLSIRWETSA